MNFEINIIADKNGKNPRLTAKLSINGKTVGAYLKIKDDINSLTDEKNIKILTERLMGKIRSKVEDNTRKELNIIKNTLNGNSREKVQTSNSN